MVLLVKEKKTCVNLPEPLFLEFKSISSKRHKFKRGYTRIGFIESLHLYNILMPILDPYFREIYGDHDTYPYHVFLEFNKEVETIIKLGLEQHRILND